MLYNIFNSYFLNNDIAYPWQVLFQDPASNSFSSIIEFHNIIVFYLIIVSVVTFWMLIIAMVKFSSNATKDYHLFSNKYLTHADTLELIWTLTPCVILVLIAFPSFNLLYLSDEIVSPSVTVKAVGHQWYWSYEYTDVVNEDGEGIEFDSYMVPESDLEEGQFRLLDVDSPLVLPYNMYIRIVTTAVDVIHDFAVPSLGIKIDATPGRLTQVSTLINRTGHFYGQCSELCGANHGFMPIHVHAVTPDEFVEWVEEQLG